MKTSIRRKLVQTIVLFSLSSLLFITGCGGQLGISQASKVCRTGTSRLKKRIGPEFNKLISVTPLPISPPDKYGCVLVYTRVLEELPGEVTGSFISSSQPHELAFVIPDYEGRLVVTEPPLPKHRRGFVEMMVKLAEVHGGGAPEILVEEREIGSHDQIHALRIFLYADGVPSPKEIFSERMSMKSEAGIERPATWFLGEFEELPAIFLKGSGLKHERVHMWHESLQTYRFDLAATQRRKVSENASQPNLLRKKATAKSSNMPKSLVGIIKEPSKAKTKKSTPSFAPIEPKENTDKAAPKPSESDTKSKDKQVTTVDEFLEGL